MNKEGSMGQRWQRFGLALALTVSAVGCATTTRGFTGTESALFITSDPPGSTAIAGGQVITTPGRVAMSRTRKQIVVVKKEGYQTRKLELPVGFSWKQFGLSLGGNTATIGWWTLGIGTIIGMIVDAFSGAMRDVKTDGIHVILQPGQALPDDQIPIEVWDKGEFGSRQVKGK